MPLSVQTSQKTSGSLSNLHVNDWQENGRRIRADTLHSVSRYFQEPDWGPAGLRKRTQCNKSGFCIAAKPQDPQDQHWSSEDQRHYFEDLQDGSLHLFSVG